MSQSEPPSALPAAPADDREGLRPAGAGAPEGRSQPHGRSIVLFITGLHLGGGAEVQFVHLATHLARRGWRVDVVSLMPGNHFAPPLEAAGVAVHSLGIPRGRYDPRALTRLVSFLRSRSPQVLCTFLFHANVLGRVAARIAGIPTVVSSIRNVDFGGRTADRLLRWTDRLCDLTTTNSRLAADALASRGVVRPGRLRVVPNGIDTSRFDALARERGWLRTEIGLAEDAAEFVWLSVGRLEPQKAYDVSLRALAWVAAQRGEDVHLAIVGEGGLRAELEQQATRLGVRGSVTLLGVRSDVPRLMRSADGFLMSSGWEGLPNVVMEALAARTPVVSTAVGGVPELIEDGISGWLVPAGDAEALGRAMMQVMRAAPHERAAMTAAGRRHLDDEFALASVLASWERLFDEVLAERRVRSGQRSDRSGRSRALIDRS